MRKLFDRVAIITRISPAANQAGGLRLGDRIEPITLTQVTFQSTGNRWLRKRNFMNNISDQDQISDCAFPISLIPDEQDFIAARIALYDGEHECISGDYFQHYVAMIATCVRRGHRSVADIVAQIAPVVGADNAAHLPWLMQILSGPARDVHLWDWEGHDAGRCFYGPTIELKLELENLASAQA